MTHAQDPSPAKAAGQAERAGSVAEGEPQAGERVAKALARAGVASRREVERLIASGRVSLNGKVLDTPAVKVQPGDVLAVDGRPVAEPEAVRVWRYHKPAGLVTTHSDPQGRPTVFAHLPPGLPRVISVGRLDLNSEGLLLLTNDGGLARALELPANRLVRRYRARARGRVGQAELDRLKEGLTVDGIRYGPIEARLEETSGGGVNRWISVTLAEGKNREVRKVLEAIGLTVNRLIRLTYGPFDLGDLAAGEAQEVGPRVIRERLGRLLDGRSLPGGDAAPAKSRAARPRAARPVAGEASPDEAKARGKPAYKAGWAKPKKRASPQRPKAGAKPRDRRPSGV
ncbi:MAG: rRNA pseudouridine synthase [Caulobacteraceae bacterium]|nr:rRNA pseudouridine synthase [Caulobacteraceae bacterium]